MMAAGKGVVIILLVFDTLEIIMHQAGNSGHTGGTGGSSGDIPEVLSLRQFH